MGSCFACGADALVRLSTAAELRVSKITRLRAPWNPTFRKPRKVGHRQNPNRDRDAESRLSKGTPGWHPSVSFDYEAD
jgi:hypothetical protein